MKKIVAFALLGVALQSGALAITASVYRQLPLDPSRDLRGVTMLGYSPHLLVVHPSVPANNQKELVALSQGAEVHTMTPPEFTTFFERERKNWAAVVAQGGVKID